jgi:hypothetical protein
MSHKSYFLYLVSVFMCVCQLTRPLSPLAQFLAEDERVGERQQDDERQQAVEEKTRPLVHAAPDQLPNALVSLERISYSRRRSAAAVALDGNSPCSACLYFVFAAARVTNRKGK